MDRRNCVWIVCIPGFSIYIFSTESVEDYLFEWLQAVSALSGGKSKSLPVTKSHVGNHCDWQFGNSV